MYYSRRYTVQYKSQEETLALLQTNYFAVKATDLQKGCFLECEEALATYLLDINYHAHACCSTCS